MRSLPWCRQGFVPVRAEHQSLQRGTPTEPATSQADAAIGQACPARRFEQAPVRTQHGTEGKTMKHTHDAIVHAHEHAHVVHYLRHGTRWEHMAATHSHEHNHPAVEHDHEPHVSAEAEHLRQAHDHDHAHPASS